MIELWVFICVKSNVAEQVSQNVPEDVASSLNVVYFPQLGWFWSTHFIHLSYGDLPGYLICVPMREEWQDLQAIEDMAGWTFQV